MEPGRLGVKIFLALLYDKPLESELSPREYEAFMEMRRHAGKLPCDNTPPKPKTKTKTLRVKKPFSNPKKKSIKSLRLSRQPPPPKPQPLPTKYVGVLTRKGADEVKLVYTKKLFKTDTLAHQDRLLMAQLDTEFLTPKEKVDLLEETHRISVRVIGPDLNEYGLCLSFWKGPMWYVINSQWRQLVECNGLKTGDAIQVWSFRVDGDLGFIVHKIDSSESSGSRATMEVDIIDEDNDEHMDR